MTEITPGKLLRLWDQARLDHGFGTQDEIETEILLRYGPGPAETSRKVRKQYADYINRIQNRLNGDP